jgi:hypothetical protein
MTPLAVASFVRAAFVLVAIAVVAFAAPDLARLAPALAEGHRVLVHGVGPSDGAHGWLSGAIAVALFDRFGVGGLAAVATASWLVALAGVAVRAGRRASPPFAAGAVVLAIACSVDVMRPGIDGLWVACASLTFVLLDAPSPLAALGVGFLAALWCNLAPEGIFASAFAVLIALGRTLDEPRSRTTRDAWLVVAAALLGTLATPSGIGYVAAAWAALHLRPGDVGALAPAEAAPLGYRIGFTLVVLATLAFGMGTARRRDVPTFLTALVAGFASGALLPLVAIVAGPPLAAAADRANALAPNVATSRSPRGVAFAVAGFAAIVACGAIVSGALAARRHSASDWTARAPYPLLARAARNGHAPRLFCANLAWCDLAETVDVPVVLDSRVDLVPATTATAYRTIVRVGPHWRARLRELGANAVLVDASSPLATLLALSHWRRVGDDGGTTLYERAKVRS